MQVRHFIILFLVFVAIVLLFLGRAATDMQNEIDYYKKRDALRDQQILNLRFKLKQSNELRDSLIRSSHDLYLANENLLRADSLNRAEDRKIKGSHDKKNATELQNEMTRRAQ